MKRKMQRREGGIGDESKMKRKIARGMKKISGLLNQVCKPLFHLPINFPTKV